MTAKRKLLISTTSFGEYDHKPIELLRSSNIDYILNPYRRTLTTNELITLLERTELLIAGTEKITEEVFRKCKSLKMISRCGVGLDSIDLGSAKKFGVHVACTSDAPVLSVAELTLGLMINLFRFVHQADRSIRSNRWEKYMGNLLTGKTVGILGYGRIGQKLSELLVPFETKLLLFDIETNKTAGKSGKLGNFVSLENLLSQSDIVSIHLPLTERTRHLIGKEELFLMKPSSFLVNTARGGIINEEALFEALSTRKIKGAAIDVYEKEPYNGKLQELDNVILTAHMGSYTKETRANMEYQAVQNIVQFIQNNSD